MNGPRASSGRSGWGRSRLRERRRRRSRTGAVPGCLGAARGPGRTVREPGKALLCQGPVRRSTESRPCPGHTLGHSMSDNAGRSPGSRVVARCAPSRVAKPSGCPPPRWGWTGASRSPLTVARTATDLGSKPPAPRSAFSASLKAPARSMERHSHVVPSRLVAQAKDAANRLSASLPSRATFHSDRCRTPGGCRPARLDVSPAM